MAGFVVDLYYLEKTAKDHLPTLVAVYGNALGRLNSAQAALDGISPVPEELKGAGTSVAQACHQFHQALAAYWSQRVAA